MILRTALLAAALMTAAIASAKCAMFMGQDAQSPNGQYRIVVARLTSGNYNFEFFKRDGKGWKSVAKSNVPAHGHHAQFYVANDGSGFALYDRYEGVEIYSPAGKARATWTADQILKTVGDKRVGHWTCHGNGGWTEDGKPVRTGDTLSANAGTGSRIVVDFTKAALRKETPPDRMILVLTGVAASAAVYAATGLRR